MRLMRRITAREAACWYGAAMQSQASLRFRVVTLMIPACAIALLLCACTASPQQDGTSSYSCMTPPSDLATCLTDTDCAMVTVGCYCGSQPVNGVARKYAKTAQSCEDSAATTCALGCATTSGMITQDGTTVAAGATIGARCERPTSAIGTCKTYVPSMSPGSGSGDPPPTGW